MKLSIVLITSDFLKGVCLFDVARKIYILLSKKYSGKKQRKSWIFSGKNIFLSVATLQGIRVTDQDRYTLFFFIRMVFFRFKMNILSFLSEIILR